MTIGFQYVTAPDLSSVGQGSFFFDVSALPVVTLTVGNQDQNFNNVFPLSTNYNELVSGRVYATLDFYDLQNSLGATMWLVLSTESTPAAGTTRYNLVDYVVSDIASAAAGTNYFILLRLEQLVSLGPTGPIGVAGPTGAVGSNGQTGPTGQIGFTGPPGPALGSVALRGTTADQTVTNNTVVVVTLGAQYLSPSNADLSTTPASSLITINTTGRYMLTARCNWTGSPTAGMYVLGFEVAGSVLHVTRSSVPILVGLTGGVVGSDLGQTITSLVSLTSGQVVRLVVYQTSSGSRTISGADATLAAYLFVQRIS